MTPTTKKNDSTKNGELKSVALDDASAHKASTITSAMASLSAQIAQTAIEEVKVQSYLKEIENKKLKLIKELDNLTEARLSAYNAIAVAHGIDLNEPGWFLEVETKRFVRKDVPAPQ